MKILKINLLKNYNNSIFKINFDYCIEEFFDTIEKLDQVSKRDVMINLISVKLSNGYNNFTDEEKDNFDNIFKSIEDNNVKLLMIKILI